MPKGFDFSTTEILDWELEAIQRALWRQEIDIDDHAIRRATERGIAAVQLLVEEILLNNPIFHVAGKKRLTRDNKIEFVLVDVSEVEIERPKKTTSLL